MALFSIVKKSILLENEYNLKLKIIKNYFFVLSLVLLKSRIFKYNMNLSLEDS